jgi:thiopurine S-methyltransferase
MSARQHEEAPPQGERAFWEDRWARGQIGFHQAAPTAALVRHAEHLGPKGKVLVPLAGKSLDLVWLAERGHEVHGVELVARAVADFWAERGVEPARETVGALLRHAAPLPGLEGSVALFQGDIFDTTRAHVGEVDAVFDRAALVALPDEARRRYAAHLLSLVREGAALLLVTFELEPAPPGPPFSVPEDEVRALFGHAAELTLLERRELDEEGARFRERGATSVREAVWLVRR